MSTDKPLKTYHIRNPTYRGTKQGVVAAHIFVWPQKITVKIIEPNMSRNGYTDPKTKKRPKWINRKTLHILVCKSGGLRAVLQNSQQYKDMSNPMFSWVTTFPELDAELLPEVIALAQSIGHKFKRNLSEYTNSMDVIRETSHPLIDRYPNGLISEFRMAGNSLKRLTKILTGSQGNKTTKLVQQACDAAYMKALQTVFIFKGLVPLETLQAILEDAVEQNKYTTRYGADHQELMKCRRFVKQMSPEWLSQPQCRDFGFTELIDGATLFNLIKEKSPEFVLPVCSGFGDLHDQLSEIWQTIRRNPGPPKKLPGKNLIPELENERVKMSNELIELGAKLHHCVGVFADDNYLAHFVRGTVVCQVNIRRKEVIQCYDKYNRDNAAAKAYRKEVEKLLARQE